MSLFENITKLLRTKSNDKSFFRAKFRMACLNQIGYIKKKSDREGIYFEVVRDDVLNIFRSFRKPLDYYKEQIKELDKIYYSNVVWDGYGMHPFSSIESSNFVFVILNTLKREDDIR